MDFGKTEHNTRQNCRAQYNRELLFSHFELFHRSLHFVHRLVPILLGDSKGLALPPIHGQSLPIYSCPETFRLSFLRPPCSKLIKCEKRNYKLYHKKSIEYLIKRKPALYVVRAKDNNGFLVSYTGTVLWILWIYHNVNLPLDIDLDCEVKFITRNKYLILDFQYNLNRGHFHGYKEQIQ